MPTPTSDDAVKNATRRSWSQWFAVLDKAGARKMVHKDIARLLAEKHEVSPWWSQMVTVGYEQARGMREKHQKADGYSVGASKTINVPVATLYAALTCSPQSDPPAMRVLPARWAKETLDETQTSQARADHRQAA